MVRHGGSSVGLYLDDPTSPIPSSCDITAVFDLLRDTSDCPKCQLTKNHIAFGQTEAWSDESILHKLIKSGLCIVLLSCFDKVDH